MNEGKSQLAKAATVFATVLVISLGLCGINWAIVAKTNKYEQLLLNTGLLEILGISLGLIGLFVVALVAIGRVTFRSFSGRKSDSAAIIDKSKEK